MTKLNSKVFIIFGIWLILVLAVFFIWGTKQFSAAATVDVNANVPGGCFLAGTPILMADGDYKDIEDIKVGDFVISYDEITGRLTLAQVLQTFSHQVDGYLEINNQLEVTANHPFYVNGQWLKAGKLKRGDKLLNKKGKFIEVKSIKVKRQDIVVFNLEVGGNHNYFAYNYLAHNKGPPPPPPPCIPVATTCGTCVGGQQTCTNGCDSWVQACGVCTPGETQQCGTTDVGVCQYGTMTCGADGTWGDCLDSIGPTTEICDGLDNDCDDYTDEGCEECSPEGATRQCGTTDVGVCEYGTQTCSGGFWGDCLDAVYPGAEVCGDNLDNDCDDYTDEGCEECTPEGAIRGCGTTDVGVCKFGTEICTDGFWGPCEGVISPGTEICGDNLDNDCDSETDEDCICNPDWQCEDWSECVDGVETRICVDLNNCGTLEGQPPVIRSCVPECRVACGACQNLVLETCSCVPIIPCCGNDTCETGENFLNCSLDCPFIPPPPPVIYQCSDEIDNDADGLIDYPDDPGCRNKQDDDERNIIEEIQEGDVVNIVDEVIDVVQDKVVPKAIVNVIDNPIIEETTHDIVAPTIVTVTTVSTFSSFSLLTLLSYLRYLFIEPLAFVARRRRKKWGVVYNSLTKQPIDLAIVRLYKKDTKQLFRSKVTDKLGRFNFLVPPGEYYITVTKPKYTFPTEFLKDKKEDPKYLDIYHGETIEVTEKGALLTANIPSDPVEEVKPVKKIVFVHYLRKLQYGVAFSSIILSLIMIFIIPSALTVALFSVHCLSYALFRRLSYVKRPKNWGIIYDEKTKKPLGRAIARIYDQEYNKLLETQVTDAKGRYSFLVDKNIYYVTAEKPGYKREKTKSIDLISKARELIVGIDIGLERFIKGVRPPEEIPPKLPVPPEKEVTRESLEELMKAKEVAKEKEVEVEPKEKVEEKEVVKEEVKPKEEVTEEEPTWLAKLGPEPPEKPEPEITPRPEPEKPPEPEIPTKPEPETPPKEKEPKPFLEEKPPAEPPKEKLKEEKPEVSEGRKAEEEEDKKDKKEEKKPPEKPETSIFG